MNGLFSDFLKLIEAIISSLIPRYWLLYQHGASLSANLYFEPSWYMNERHCNLFGSPRLNRTGLTLEGPFAKYQLSDGSPLVSMVSINENVKFPLNIRYF
jgi:hypothetical protein